MKTPTTLEECFEQLQLKLDLGELTKFRSLQPDKDGFILGYRFNLGLMMRNSWGLWIGRNKLCKYFHSLGIYHADDMSTIIINSFHRILNDKPIEINKQVKFYIKYWKSQGFKDGNPCNTLKKNRNK